MRREEKAIDQGSNLDREPFNQRFPEDSPQMIRLFQEKNNHIMNKSFMKERNGDFYLHVRSSQHLHFNFFMLSLSDYA